MLQFKCCGADSYTDWYRSDGWGNPRAVPDSCCVVKSAGCGHDKTKVHTKVCWTITFQVLSHIVLCL